MKSNMIVNELEKFKERKRKYLQGNRKQISKMYKALRKHES